MGSPSSSPSPPPLPPPPPPPSRARAAAAAAAVSDASAIRTKRVLQAAATARRDVSSFVSSFSAPKPPRAPPNAAAAASAAAAAAAAAAARKDARRRSLVSPLDDEARARLALLEQQVRDNDAALLALKKQLGRALIRARHARQERDAAAVKLTRLAALLRKQQASLLAERTDAATLLDDVDACVAVFNDALPQHPSPPAPALRSAVEHLVSAAELARVNLSVPIVPFDAADLDDDDAKSVTSFASSLADDRDAQLDTLVELVQLLESRLSTADPNGVAAAAATRARRTIQRARLPDAAHQRKRAPSPPSLAANGTNGAADADADTDADAHPDADASGAAPHADARLREAQRQLRDMTARVSALQKMAERAVKADQALANNVQLESQLHAAKKTIQRLLQQRCAKPSPSHRPSSHSPHVNLRRHSSDRLLVQPEQGRPPPPPPPTRASLPPVPAHGANADTVRRILDWRQRASENHALPPGGAVDAANGADARLLNLEAHSVVDSFGSVSAKSLPVQGFLKRHDSFLSMGGVSASGEEIMLANGRNPFATSKTPKVDGLRFLLG